MLHFAYIATTAVTIRGKQSVFNQRAACVVRSAGEEPCEILPFARTVAFALAHRIVLSRIWPAEDTRYRRSGTRRARLRTRSLRNEKKGERREEEASRDQAFRLA